MKCPILFWALFFLLGSASILYPHLILILPLLILIFLTQRKIQGFLFFIGGALYTFFQMPGLDEGPHPGHGIFSISSISPTQSPFATSYVLKGKFNSFETDDATHYNIPCIIFQKKVPQTGTKFYLEGTLEKGIFKSNQRPWIETESHFSLVQWRFKAKEKMRAYFHTLKDKKVGHFYASMVTGNIDDRLLAMEFQKLGLGHILAISGFHFALVALALGSVFRLFLPHKLAYISLLIVLTLYFIYLGPAPSIVRAYLMISLYILGLLLNRSIHPLNLLGTAMLIELIANPLHIQEAGFQLSFLATFGILTLYSPFERLFQLLLPKRPISTLKEMSIIDQHGFLLATFLRKGLALNTAVHLVTLPVTLFTFHVFPLLSLIYNLLLPPLIGISLMAIPFGPLGYPYSRFVLDLISYPPEILNFKIFAPTFPFELLIVILTIIGSLGLTLSHQLGQNRLLFAWRS